jgi:hypothetical protein
VHFTNDAGAICQLRLLNAQGRLVLEQTVEAATAGNDISIPVPDLSPGIYELVLQRNGVFVGQARVVKN